MGFPRLVQFSDLRSRPISFQLVDRKLARVHESSCEHDIGETVVASRNQH
jgi:hypothetical protein